MKQNGLTKGHALTLLVAKEKYRSQREQRASSLLSGLTGEYRTVHGLPSDAQIGAADQALLVAAASAQLEIELTTARLAAGRAHSKALKNLGFARSELRRSLRALAMIGDSGEQRDDPNAPPPGATNFDRAVNEIIAARQPHVEAESEGVDVAPAAS